MFCFQDFCAMFVGVFDCFCMFLIVFVCFFVSVFKFGIHDLLV